MRTRMVDNIVGILICRARKHHAFHNSQPIRSRANSLPGANQPIGPWAIRSLELSLP